MLKDDTRVGGKLKATMEHYGVRRTAVERIAKESGAKVKIGGTTWFDWRRMDAYLDKLAEPERN